MAHFAKVLNGKVLSVIVAEQDFINKYVDDSPGEWIQTSYNTYNNIHSLGGTPLRKNYASVGGNYDLEGDFFYSEQPFLSWNLNRTSGSWEAPVVYPDDDKEYYWDESTTNWKEAD